MECLVCHQKIEPGEVVFWGTEMVCGGHGESDCEYSEASSGVVGAVHLICLESPAAAAGTSGEKLSKPVLVVNPISKENSMVERSDALSVFRD